MTKRGDERRAAEALDRWWDGAGRIGGTDGSPLAGRFAGEIDRLTGLDRALAVDRPFLDGLEARLFSSNEGAPRNAPSRTIDRPSRGVRWRLTQIRHAPLTSGASLVATAALVVVTFGIVALVAWTIAGGGNRTNETDRPVVAAPSPAVDASANIDACLVEPPTKESVGSIRARPAPTPEIPSQLSGGSGPVDVLLPGGPPADAGTVAGIEATLRLLTACRYHDQEPFVLGWASGEPAGRYFGLYSAEYFRYGQTGGFFSTTIGLGGRSWRPQDEVPPTLEASAVMPDGRIAAIVVDDGGPGTFPTETLIIFRQVGGMWLVDGIVAGQNGGEMVPGTPAARPIVVTFRQDGVTLELIRYSLIEGERNVLTLVNVGEQTRGFRVPSIGLEVTVPPLTQLDVAIDAPPGDHLVFTSTGDEEDPALIVPCSGAQFNAATLRVYPAGAIAVNSCAEDSFI